MNRYWKRAAVGVALSAAVLKLASGPEPATDPNYGKCQVEDVVPVEIVQDAFEYEAGDAACVHIDNLVPAGRTPR